MNFYGVRFLLDSNNIDYWGFYLSGLYYAIPFLSILTIHEFGHYFVAKWHGLKSSLPYYIPFWLPFSTGTPYIGTMGAVIRLKSPTRSTKQYFDVGIAGPLAGFALALVVITYGFLSLPPREAIYQIHPEYYQNFDAQGLKFEDYAYSKEAVQPYLDSLAAKGHTEVGIPLFSVGSNLLFTFFEKYIVSDKSRIPNKYELIHYPFLFAGYVALFFTALNLLPIGQLDGGHVVYGLFGYEKAKKVSIVIYTLFVFYAGLGFEHISILKNSLNDLLFHSLLYIGFLFFLYSKVFEKPLNAITVALLIFTGQFFLNYYAPHVEGYSGWFVFSFILARVIGVFHPKAEIEQKLNRKRILLGWFALIVFLISASPTPFMIEIIK